MVIRELGTVGLPGMGKVVEVAFGINGDFIDIGITRGIFIEKASGTACMGLNIIDNSWFRTGLELPRNL